MQWGETTEAELLAALGKSHRSEVTDIEDAITVLALLWS